ncbi:hypothetical protein GR210_13145 [Rhizobium leguminosarum]|uniref:hypothetical protein n=1 Tax=Rhizobium leguminosarum TaxID=384 RepID=UPI0003701832|nr:hypothetical protein [Rhizobium leguminosarum]NEH49722.1 hypothetical protein [Rhizobium leguminosarum]
MTNVTTEGAPIAGQNASQQLSNAAIFAPVQSSFDTVSSDLVGDISNLAASMKVHGVARRVIDGQSFGRSIRKAPNCHFVRVDEVRH